MNADPPRLLSTEPKCTFRASPMESRALDLVPTYLKELIAGGVAGGVAKTVVAPLDRVKILYQTRSLNFQSIGVMRSLHYILKNEGPLGLYKGNAASVIRAVPYAALHFMMYEHYRRWMTVSFPLNIPGSAVELLAGSLAGGTAIMCTYPLDLARTRLAQQVSIGSCQMSSNTLQQAGHLTAYKGMTDVVSQVYKENGLRGLYRGVVPTLYGMLPYAGLKFYIYAKLKSAMPSDQQNCVSTKLACGAVAGLVGQTVIYPLDVVRRQMQVQNLSSTGLVMGPHYRNTLHGLVYIARMQGWRQMFSGLGINHMKLVPSVAVGFAAYDGMKTWLQVPQKQ